jgi:hypothetical protein
MNTRIMIMVAILVFACAGCSTNGEPRVARDYFADIGSATCERAVECMTPTREPCVETFVDAACAVPTAAACDLPLELDDPRWTECLDALAMQDCDEARQGYLPDVCLEIDALFHARERDASR